MEAGSFTPQGGRQRRRQVCDVLGEWCGTSAFTRASLCPFPSALESHEWLSLLLLLSSPPPTLRPPLPPVLASHAPLCPSGVWGRASQAGGGSGRLACRGRLWAGKVLPRLAAAAGLPSLTSCNAATSPRERALAMRPSRKRTSPASIRFEVAPCGPRRHASLLAALLPVLGPRLCPSRRCLMRMYLGLEIALSPGPSQPCHAKMGCKLPKCNRSNSNLGRNVNKETPTHAAYPSRTHRGGVPCPQTQLSLRRGLYRTALPSAGQSNPRHKARCPQSPTAHGRSGPALILRPTDTDGFGLAVPHLVPTRLVLGGGDFRRETIQPRPPRPARSMRRGAA